MTLREIFLFYLVVLFHFSGTAQYYFAHINIIDIEKGIIIRDQSVCIVGNHIFSISSLPINKPKAQVYDCTGKFLMPGLWDMHIHDGGDSATRYEYVPLFLANGVTGVRDMWGSQEMITLRNEI